MLYLRKLWQNYFIRIQNLSLSIYSLLYMLMHVNSDLEQ